MTVELTYVTFGVRLEELACAGVTVAMSRPYPWKCRSCAKPALSPTIVDYSTVMEHDGRSYSITVPNLEILECESCHERVLPDNALERIIDELRAKAGLLAPLEIREKRKRLGLTQEQLANHLGIAKETVSRWETGGQIQQRHSDLILRAYFDLPAFQEYLKVKTGERATAPIGDEGSGGARKSA